jgi:ABC-type transport system involved in multi-copper enzyme maturation permease subunit
MTDTESQQDRRPRASKALTILLITLAPVILVLNVTFGVEEQVSTYPGEATLLTWVVLAQLLIMWFARRVVRIAFAVSLLITTPLLVTRFHWGYDITFGFASPLEATILTCVGIVALVGLTLVGRGLPLVSKELLEQAARRRTYTLRFVYACLAFLAGFSFSFQILHQNWGNPYAILGKGQELFKLFVGMQFFGIYLFMPAMCCNLITSEKERDTLSLLFLTRLSPWGILIGKFLSRILPMLFFMSLSLPLFGFAYSMGGFETELIWSAAWALLVTTIQVGTLALLCSCWFRRTVGAFIASYIFGFLMLFGPLMLDEWTGIFRKFHEQLVPLFGTGEVLGYSQYNFAGMFFGVVALFDGRPSSLNLLSCIMRTIPMVLLSAIFLLLSRMCVVRRATAQPRNLLLKIFRSLDSLFWTLNQHFGRGIVLSRGSSRLPADRPIAWRETTHRTLGTARYLVRIFILLEFPVLFVCAMCVGSSGGGLEIMSVMLMMIWVVVSLLICGASTSLISAERSSQTFDTLLTTPLTNRDILRQKFVGTRRLMFVLSVPLLTIYSFQTMLRFDVPGLGPRRWGLEEMDPTSLTWCYFATGLTTVLIYLPMISWLSFWIGLKIRSQGKAICAAVGTLVAWCLIPLLVLFPFIIMMEMNGTGEGELLTIVSPMMIIPFNEFANYPDPWEAFYINTAVYGTIMLIMRFACLFRSVRLLGRHDSVPSESVADVHRALGTATS